MQLLFRVDRTRLSQFTMSESRKNLELWKAKQTKFSRLHLLVAAACSLETSSASCNCGGLVDGSACTGHRLTKAQWWHWRCTRRAEPLCQLDKILSFVFGTSPVLDQLPLFQCQKNR